LINLNKIEKIYKKYKNKILFWLGVKTPEFCIINPMAEIIKMKTSEKDILTDIVVDNHEEEFRIIETGDDGGSHFALYVPQGSETDIIAKLASERIKKRLIIITTPPGYIGTILR
jgi:CRISPR/Cas system-associated protein Cas10 (large subunit of type III CRISPR-Cas system)